MGRAGVATQVSQPVEWFWEQCPSGAGGHIAGRRTGWQFSRPSRGKTHKLYFLSPLPLQSITEEGAGVDTAIDSAYLEQCSHAVTAIHGHRLLPTAGPSEVSRGHRVRGAHVLMTPTVHASLKPMDPSA